MAFPLCSCWRHARDTWRSSLAGMPAAANAVALGAGPNRCLGRQWRAQHGMALRPCSRGSARRTKPVAANSPAWSFTKSRMFVCALAPLRVEVRMNPAPLQYLKTSTASSCKGAGAPPRYRSRDLFAIEARSFVTPGNNRSSATSFGASFL
jgi:hypothetical protein